MKLGMRMYLRAIFMIGFIMSLTIMNAQEGFKERQKATISKKVISYKGKERNARVISVKSTFDIHVDTFFQEEMLIANTLKVTKPLANIIMKDGSDHMYFEEGFTYSMRIYSMGFIPFGGIHYINIETLDKDSTFIQTREKNDIAKMWDHKLKFESVGENVTSYEDEVTLYAGWLTPMFARYLVIFYKMRHRKWNKLLKEKY